MIKSLASINFLLTTYSNQSFVNMNELFMINLLNIVHENLNYYKFLLFIKKKVSSLSLIIYWKFEFIIKQKLECLSFNSSTLRITFAM